MSRATEQEAYELLKTGYLFSKVDHPAITSVKMSLFPYLVRK